MSLIADMNSFDAFLARLKMDQPQLDAIWAKLKPFNLEKVKQGQHYIYRYDIRSGKHYCDVRDVAAPNAATLVWVGEWLVFDEAEEDEMYDTLRMYDPAAFEVIQ